MENYNNDRDIAIWGQLPILLQWILYVPVVFAVPFILIFLLNLLGLVRGDFDGVFLYLQTTFNSGLFAFIFVWLAVNLAPRANKFSAWFLYFAWSIFVLLSIVRIVYIWLSVEIGFVQEDILEFLGSLAWFGVGIPALLYFGKKRRN